ncbi:MAG: G-D-S-L family lipolytic protein [Chitinophagia bacterium]|nr:G-D-S-L family lipolytic protein [Chitinophagia bacterium]
MLNRSLLLTLACPILFLMDISAQPFIKEIEAFRRADSLSRPPEKPILFIGSSSFTKWTSVSTDFPGRRILNRAFGGSSLPHLIQYADDVIFKYDPRQILIYCGENDLTGGPQITADSVLQRFERLMSLIRSRLPRVPVVFLSLKPSPSREALLPVMREANRLIEARIRKMRRTRYLDVHNPMLNADGSMKEDIYVSDRLHMNRKGYEIWMPLIRPLLAD